MHHVPQGYAHVWPTRFHVARIHVADVTTVRTNMAQGQAPQQRDAFVPVVKILKKNQVKKFAHPQSVLASSKGEPVRHALVNFVQINMASLKTK